jgi:hypothetical protein
VDPQDGRASGRDSSIRSLLVACALVGLALLPVAAGIAWLGYARSGPVGVGAAAIAAGVCWLSACLALVTVFVGQRLDAGIQGILAGMLFRMGLPLAVAMAFKYNSPPLAEAGIFWMILGLYLVALVVETLLSLRFVPKKGPGMKPTPVIDVARGAQGQ